VSIRMSARTALDLIRAHEITLDTTGQLYAVAPQRGKTLRLPLLTKNKLREKGTR